MIRIRHKDGSTTDITEPGTFVELVNDMDGSVMQVSFTPEAGQIMILNQGTDGARRYEQMFANHGVKFTKETIELKRR